MGEVVAGDKVKWKRVLIMLCLLSGFVVGQTPKILPGNFTVGLWTLEGGSVSLQAHRNPVYLLPYRFQSIIFRPEKGLWTLEGGTVGFQQIRNPLYVGSKKLIPAGCPAIILDIYSPLSGHNYFNNNVLLNFSSDGFSCRYKTSGSWNNISCIFNDTRTFTSGDVNLTIQASRNGCMTEKSVSFFVRDFQAEYVPPIEPFLFLPLVLALLFVLLDDDDAKKRPPRHTP